MGYSNGALTSCSGAASMPVLVQTARASLSIKFEFFKSIDKTMSRWSGLSDNLGSSQDGRSDLLVNWICAETPLVCMVW